MRAIETGNENGGDPARFYIICDFELPCNNEMRDKLLEQQVREKQREMTLEDVELSNMAVCADMLEPIAPSVGGAYNNMPYVLICTGENCEYINGLCGSISYDMGSLIQMIRENAEEMELYLDEVTEMEGNLDFYYHDKEEYIYARYTIMRVPALYTGVVTGRGVEHERKVKPCEQQRSHRVSVRKVRRVLQKFGRSHHAGTAGCIPNC